MMRVRGTDAFALQITADNAHVEMTADLLGGAQTGRSDRLVSLGRPTVPRLSVLSKARSKSS